MKDQLTNQFSITPNCVTFDPFLKAGDTRIYAALRSHRDEETKEPVYPAKLTIAKRLKCSEDTVARAIARLICRGHISYTKGNSMWPNRYQFTDNYTEDTSSNATILDAGKRVNSRKLEQTLPAQMRHQPESLNHNHNPEESLRLYHGGDLASVIEDGSIRIKTHSGEWVNYGGGDDAGFSFGELRGIEAKNAGLMRYASKSRTIPSLPTESENPNSHHFPTPALRQSK